jgi:hypothetical protein
MKESHSNHTTSGISNEDTAVFISDEPEEY